MILQVVVVVVRNIDYVWLGLCVQMREKGAKMVYVVRINIQKLVHVVFSGEVKRFPSDRSEALSYCLLSTVSILHKTKMTLGVNADLLKSFSGKLDWILLIL